MIRVLADPPSIRGSRGRRTRCGAANRSNDMATVVLDHVQKVFDNGFDAVLELKL
jgi:hypothetical protein